MDIKSEIEAMRVAHATPAGKLGNSRIRAYIRVSSNSIGQDQRRQLIAYQEFVYQSALTDKMTYLEVNSAVGGKIRKVFKNMVKDAKANKFDILWCEQPSRLGRDVRDGLNIMHELHEVGIKVFFQKFNKILDLDNSTDRMMFIFFMMVAETESKWNSDNTKNSNKGKMKQLKPWAKENGLLSVGFGGGCSWMHQLIKDPYYNNNENKKGLIYVEIPYMVEMFQVMHKAGYSNSYIANHFRYPVKYNCSNECWNGKEMPFGEMPRIKGEHGKTKKVTRKDVAEWLEAGGWSQYIKSDSQVKKTHPEAFETKSGPREKRTCGCGQKMSAPTICTHIKKYCYDLGEPKRSPHAFERAEAESTEVSLDHLGRILEAGTTETE
jgi:predicted site-specific integrase-resolvase